MKAYSASTTPKKLKDEQATPRAVFERIQEVLGVQFAHDVCASAKNKKCKSFWSKRNNALTISWADTLETRLLPVLWMNPPYSMLSEFTEKASYEASKGCIVVGLVPHISSSRWYQENVHNVASTVYLPDGRINFELEGVVRPGNALPSCVPIWTPWQCATSYQFYTRKANA